MPTPEVFAKIVDLMLARGLKNIKNLPACAEIVIDDRWWVAINGHPDPIECSKGTMVPAYCAYIEFNGWPAGFVSPHGGSMAAGSLANEDTLIAAIDAALKQETTIQ